MSFVDRRGRDAVHVAQPSLSRMVLAIGVEVEIERRIAMFEDVFLGVADIVDGPGRAAPPRCESR